MKSQSSFFLGTYSSILFIVDDKRFIDLKRNIINYKYCDSIII
jgi:hypothetical protein